MLRVVGRTHAALKQRQAASGVQVRPRYKKLRSSSELAASQASRLRRQASYHEVVSLYQQGKSIAAIVEQLHLSPTTVRTYVYAGAFPERATHFRRKGQLGSYLPYLEQRAQGGCDNASLLWREIRDQGFTKGYKVVNTWLREYLQKPGRRSSEQEQARRQAFWQPCHKRLSRCRMNESGEFVLRTTDPIRYNASAVDFFKAVSPILNPNGATIDIDPEFDRVTRIRRGRSPTTSSVRKVGNVYLLTFQGEHRFLSIHDIDTRLLDHAGIRCTWTQHEAPVATVSLGRTDGRPGGCRPDAPRAATVDFTGTRAVAQPGQIWTVQRHAARHHHHATGHGGSS